MSEVAPATARDPGLRTVPSNPNSEIWNRPRPRRRARPRCTGIPRPQKDRCPATNLFCQSECETIGTLEDEDDDEHEDDSSNSEFRLKYT